MNIISIYLRIISVSWVKMKGSALTLLLMTENGSFASGIHSTTVTEIILYFITATHLFVRVAQTELGGDHWPYALHAT